MKKNIKFLFPLLAATLCACQSVTIQPKKIANYLFEITLNDYPAEAPEHMVDTATTEFSCSAVRNGNFYGRNLDFFVSEISEFVVHTTATENRHASIGVSRLLHMTDAEIEAGLTREQLNLLPWGTFDGINDTGLFCNMNVTPAQDSGLTHTSPDPSKPELNCVFLVRALLDNCADVNEAIEYINSHSVTGMNKGGFDLHFMIGDPEKTIILEYVDNKAVIVEHNIMTNFLVCKLPEFTEHADGTERFDILEKNYQMGGESMEGMWNLLRMVRFSKAYDPQTEPFWISEFYSDTVTNRSSVEEVLADEAVKSNIENFQHFKLTGEYTPQMHLWFTVHNSTYDIEKRKLRLTIREDYEHTYDFQL